MRTWHALYLVCAVMVAGCETSRTVDYETLNGKNHASIAAMVSRGTTDLQALGVTPWSSAAGAIEIDGRDAVMRLPGGMSYVELVSLPADAVGQTLTVRSYTSFNLPTSVFVPTLTFLDRDRQEIHRHASIDYRPVSTMRGDYLLGSVPVPAGAIFVLLSTDDSKIGTRHDFKARPLIGGDPKERDVGPEYASRSGGVGSSYEGRIRLGLEF